MEQFSKNRILLKRVFQIIITIYIVQSVIGITQFLIQRSIGLIWLKESIISQDIPGVAKIIFNGHAYIRAYGLFPHPNVFGGFLVFSIIISLLYFKLFHVEQFIKFMQHVKACFREIKIITIVPPARNSTSKNLNQENKASSQNVPRGTFIENFMAGEREIIVISFILLVQTLALLLTFSKSAIIGLFIGLFYLYMIKCSTSIQLFHVEHFKRHAWNILSVFRSKLFYKKIFLISSILIMLFFILKPDTYSLLFKSLQERTFYLNVSHGTFISNPLLGIGLGQFVVNMQNINNIQPWQYQPVHSVFLLILNELGIVIFFMFLYFICKLFHVEQFERKNILFTYFKTILISFLFIMLFDHYFWDIQQGQILLWLLFGIIVGNSRK